jgi:hypothetical protein
MSAAAAICITGIFRPDSQLTDVWPSTTFYSATAHLDLASSILHLQASLSSANLFQYPHLNIILASLSSTPNHVPLTSSNWSSPFRAFFPKFSLAPFLHKTRHTTHPLKASQLDIRGYLHFLVYFMAFTIKQFQTLIMGGNV